MICTLYPFQMSLADAKLSFPVHTLTMKRSGEDTSQECKKVRVLIINTRVLIINQCLFPCNKRIIVLYGNSDKDLPKKLALNFFFN